MIKTLMPLLIAVVLLSGGCAHAQTDELVRSISVSGTMQTKVAPDLVVWHIRLSDSHEKLSEAKQANDKNVRAILGLREQLGVKEGDISTGTLNIRKEYHEDERGRPLDFKGFRVYRSVTIRQRDLKRFDEYLGAFVASADLEVSFSFESSTIHEVRAETRLKALKIARDKARAMAEVVDAKLGEVLTIDEHAEGGTNRFSHAQNAVFYRSEPGADQSSETFIPVAIDVKMTVYATFRLE